MADNITISTPLGNRDVGTDEVTSVHYQRFKVVWGPDGTVNETDTASAKPFPVQLRGSTGDDVLFSSRIGSTGETAPATDTAASGLNGRLQRIAQRLTVGLTEVSTAHLITAADTNATSIKAAAGTLKSVHVFSKASTPIYVKFHNTAGAPTAGAGVVLTVGVQAGTQRDFVLPRAGRAFATGIGMTVVSGIADNSTGAVASQDAAIEVCYE